MLFKDTRKHSERESGSQGEPCEEFLGTTREESSSGWPIPKVVATNTTGRGLARDQLAQGPVQSVGNVRLGAEHASHTKRSSPRNEPERSSAQ